MIKIKIGFSQTTNMPFIRIWIHYVWATKNREPFLNEAIRQVVFKHIRENAIKKGIYIDCINGYLEHAYCIVSLGSDQTISKTIQMIKGESSFWINQNKLCNTKFEWQDEYFAVSVSESNLEKVRSYISRQEEHHKKKTFTEECDEFMAKYGFKKFE